MYACDSRSIGTDGFRASFKTLATFPRFDGPVEALAISVGGKYVAAASDGLLVCTVCEYYNATH